MGELREEREGNTHITRAAPSLAHFREGDRPSADGARLPPSAEFDYCREFLCKDNRTESLYKADKPHGQKLTAYR